MLYPDAQKRAQAEIDAVIGTDRLPTFEDRSSLPYVEAVLRETLRWHPVFPLGTFIPPCIDLALSYRPQPGLPHFTSDNDVYNELYIPKGLHRFSILHNSC